MSRIETELEEYDREQSWHLVYQRVKNESAVKSIQDELSVQEARKPENRGKNRYRDVSPYDHSRIVLKKGETDYINASLIQVPESNRRYILSQGPLEHTAGEFWQMVWEQESKAVIMLNKVIEKGTLKCHQYWPMGEEYGAEEELVFEENNVRVILLEEQTYDHYIVRLLELENLETSERREVSHFQYVTWPDFGVPSSPIAFLNFLMVVRKAGVLEPSVGPAVIHCSAGIGRSGTFCLVDSCLILIEKSRSMESLDVRSVLVNMRSYRMGLIQTPDQLRFSYLAIVAGGRRILGESNSDSVNNVLETYMNMSEHLSAGDRPPPPPKRTSSLSPSKGDRPPPPPPQRKHEHGIFKIDEPDIKHRKLGDEDLPPPKPRRTDSPDKTNSVDNFRTDKQPDTFEVNRNSELSDKEKVEILGNEIKDVKENKSITDNNRNPVDDTGSGKRESDTADHGNQVPPLQEEGIVQGAQENQTGAVIGNSTGETLSETELRRRKREERKKNTQELIAKMKEKQRTSETWKKRRSYFKPIAIGLSILLGGILLYKFYW